ncbi:hypothetical protein [uncultured Lacinutrix sp.]|uniref:hypothetical protein n=1 Tax=uncultured Lacinutrix sp. TaxID=574032 RepID=UPI0026307A66|nr:hypothetical protein [uncultured Lacinutrix sp.]
MKILGIGSRISHNEFGKGVVTNVDNQQYWVTFIENGLETIAFDEEIEIIEVADSEVDTVSFFDVEQSFMRLLKKYSDVSEVVHIGDKWKGGKLILEPGDTNLKSREIKIDDFFHKITMVRDRIRVMEQKVNSSTLEEQEKIDIQQYITRIYGSLTTFNVLFKSKEQQFVGQRSK